MSNVMFSGRNLEKPSATMGLQAVCRRYRHESLNYRHAVPRIASYYDFLPLQQQQHRYCCASSGGSVVSCDVEYTVEYVTCVRIVRDNNNGVVSSCSSTGGGPEVLTRRKRVSMALLWFLDAICKECCLIGLFVKVKKTFRTMIYSRDCSGALTREFGKYV